MRNKGNVAIYIKEHGTEGTEGTEGTQANTEKKRITQGNTE